MRRPEKRVDKIARNRYGGTRNEPLGLFIYLMANTQSALKEVRKGSKRAVRNLRVKREVRDLTKKSLKAIEDGNADAKDLVKQTVKRLDKAGKQGVLKKNTVSRKKSQLMRALNATAAKA